MSREANFIRSRWRTITISPEAYIHCWSVILEWKVGLNIYHNSSRWWWWRKIMPEFMCCCFCSPSLSSSVVWNFFCLKCLGSPTLSILWTHDLLMPDFLVNLHVETPSLNWLTNLCLQLRCSNSLANLSFLPLSCSPCRPCCKGLIDHCTGQSRGFKALYCEHFPSLCILGPEFSDGLTALSWC